MGLKKQVSSLALADVRAKEDLSSLTQMLNTFSSFIVFIFGLLVGSFLNCIVCRLEENESFLRGRSYCPDCKHKLAWQDLIPLLSFILLKGKCRYCQKPISWQNPMVELFTGLIFLLVFCILHSIFYILISCFLIIIFVYDLKHYIIPDKVIYPAILVSSIWYIVYGYIFNRIPTDEILYTIYAAVGATLFFLIIVLVSKGKWMGIGDIKLAFLMGLILGWPKIFIALFFAFFIGAVVGLGLIAASKKNLKSEVPFGPFLVAGTFFALFWGENLVNWYLNLFSC